MLKIEISGISILSLNMLLRKYCIWYCNIICIFHNWKKCKKRCRGRRQNIEKWAELPKLQTAIYSELRIARCNCVLHMPPLTSCTVRIWFFSHLYMHTRDWWPIKRLGIVLKIANSKERKTKLFETTSKIIIPFIFAKVIMFHQAFGQFSSCT